LKFVLIGVGRNPEAIVVVMYNNADLFFWNLWGYSKGKVAI